MRDYVWWEGISAYQKLSESFIREFKDSVWWDNIGRYQKLSEKFINEFTNRLSVGDLLNNNEIDPIVKFKILSDQL